MGECGGAQNQDSSDTPKALNNGCGTDLSGGEGVSPDRMSLCGWRVISRVVVMASKMAISGIQGGYKVMMMAFQSFPAREYWTLRCMLRSTRIAFIDDSRLVCDITTSAACNHNMSV